MKNSKKLIFILLCLSNSLLFSSCILKPLISSDNFQLNQASLTKSTYTVDFADSNLKKTGVNLSVAIRGLNQGFRTKAAISAIKSYEISLCTDINSPVTSRVAGSDFKFDSNPLAPNTFVTFSNVPVGGPYFAVVSAFDNTVANGSGNNLTKAQTFSGDGLQEVGISSNSVTVNANLTLSPSGITLLASLLLKDAGSGTVGTSITPVDGSNGIFGNI